MMQRIIAYICFLENTINSVCTHLGIKQLRMSSNFITDQWTGMLLLTDCPGLSCSILHSGIELMSHNEITNMLL